MVKKVVRYLFTRAGSLWYDLNNRGEIKVDKVTIFDIANFFLKIVERDAGSTITPLKLQKILYYTQGY